MITWKLLNLANTDLSTHPGQVQIAVTPIPEESMQEVLSKLEKVTADGDNRADDDPAQFVVFVHGIHSDCLAAFGAMATQMLKDSRLTTTSLFGFEYDFNAPILENATALSTVLRSFSDHSIVSVVCHSMGGLVTRAALLLGKASQVRRIFLLGTPNFGAVRTSNVHILAQLQFKAIRRAYAVFRSEGITDLTRVSQILEKLQNRNKKNADHIEYITMPGMYFHKERSFWDARARKDRKVIRYWAVESVIGALFGLLGTGIDRPHDGIVEESSNCLLPDEAGHRSEKSRRLCVSDRAASTYAHVQLEACDHLIS